MRASTHSPNVYWKIFGALWLLLALTWIIGYVDLGAFNLIIALTIAIAKALLVMMFFMHIKGSTRLLHLAASAGLLWLLILIALTFADYRTRS
jgi:cytochrome c oxidase subunit IV